MAHRTDALWRALPLPALYLDADLIVRAMNEAAELWLDISARSLVGRHLDDQRLHSRLRPDPALLALLNDPQPAHWSADLAWWIGDRAGGHRTRHAGLHLAQIPEGGFQLVIQPAIPVDAASQRGARAAIGMADMLAHEIKNPLAGIRGAAQLLAEGLGPEDLELADLIVAESRRVVALLDQVERFGDTTAAKMAPANIHDILERARRTHELAGGHPVKIAYDPSLPEALVDEDRIVQAVLNLLRNAGEAVARSDGTKVILRSRYDLAGHHPQTGMALPMVIEVEDDGPGIPEALKQHIFDPFVSGRENGTGLGLALVGKIATEHHGWITLDSEPGRTIARLSLRKG